MPADIKNDYHPKWSLIRRLIARRAEHCCEQCGAENGKLSVLLKLGNDAQGRPIIRTRLIAGQAAKMLLKAGYQLSVVQCGVAHLDQDRTNNRFSNLKFLCRACHLNHDRPYNQGKIQMTKKYGKRKGQMGLF